MTVGEMLTRNANKFPTKKGNLRRGLPISKL